MLTQVNTRCVYYHHEPLPAHHKNNMTLAPFVDLINHSSNKNVSVSRVEDALVIRSTRRIEENEEIVFSYHSASGRFWVCEYGFWLQDNEFDDLDLSTELEGILSSQREWLESEAYWGDYTVSKDGEASFRIQVALRSILEAGDMLREFMEGKNDGKDHQSQVDEILGQLLLGKVAACQQALALEKPECVAFDIVRQLWEAELRIAQNAYEKLKPVSP